ncbi:hypothetical protein [Heliomicrobium undosum]|nr:hypothetical protein [Heliomicrobium undosum]
MKTAQRIRKAQAITVEAKKRQVTPKRQRYGATQAETQRLQSI